MLFRILNTKIRRGRPQYSSSLRKHCCWTTLFGNPPLSTVEVCPWKITLKIHWEPTWYSMDNKPSRTIKSMFVLPSAIQCLKSFWWEGMVLKASITCKITWIKATIWATMKVNTRDFSQSVLAWITQWDIKFAWTLPMTKATTREWSIWWSCEHLQNFLGTRACIRIRGSSRRATTSRLTRRLLRIIKCRSVRQVSLMKTWVKLRIQMKA